MRKTFPCGHSGKGQYCHRCDIKQKQMAQRVANRALKQEELMAAEAVIGLSCDSFPVPIIYKAAEIMTSIRNGACFSDHKGKRLKYRDRNIISIPVGYSHRLLCRQEASQVETISLLSHEDYNRIWREV